MNDSLDPGASLKEKRGTMDDYANFVASKLSISPAKESLHEQINIIVLDDKTIIKSIALELIL